MKAKKELRSLMILVLLVSFFMGGCVTRARFETQVAESQSLAQQLEREAQKRRRLEEEVASLKNKLAALGTKLASLDRDLALAMNKAGQSDELSAALTRLKRSFEDELRQVKVQLGDREAKLFDLKTRQESQISEQAKRQALLDRKDKEILELREVLHLTKEDLERLKRELSEASEAHDKLVSHLEKELRDGTVTISKLKKGRLSVKIVDKILFSSGSNHITEEGKNVLKKVSSALGNITENNIRIEGHADNVPIGSAIIDRFPTNWELSSSRATQVVRFLVSQSVPAENLIAVGHSKYQPVASNDTPEGRQKNRRIEIVLLPKEVVEDSNSGK